MKMSSLLIVFLSMALTNPAFATGVSCYIHVEDQNGALRDFSDSTDSDGVVANAVTDDGVGCQASSGVDRNGVTVISTMVLTDHGHNLLEDPRYWTPDFSNLANGAYQRATFPPIRSASGEKSYVCECDLN